MAKYTNQKHSKGVKLEKIYQNIAVMMIALDEDGNVVFWNRECERVLGYSAEEIIGKSLPAELLCSDGNHGAETGNWLQFQGDFNRVEISAKHKDGSKKTILWSNVSDQPPDPEWKVWITGIDITNFKSEKAQVNTTKDWYRNLVEEAELSIVMDDVDGNIVYFNSKFAELFGYSSEEIRQKSFDSLLQPDDLVMINDYHKQRMDGKNPPSKYECRGIRKDGSTVYLEVSVAVRKEKGKIVGTRAYSWDITERKLAEQALEENQQQLQSYFDNANDLIFIIDNQGKITFVNQKVNQAIGYRADEIIGRSPLNFVTPDCIKTAGSIIERALQGEHVENFEGKLLSKTGDIIWIEAKGSRIYKEDKPAGLLNIARDITDRVKAENALKTQKYQLESEVKERTEALTNAVQRLTHIKTVGEKIGSCSTLDDRMQVVVQDLVERLGFDFVVLSLYDDDNQVATKAVIYPSNKRLERIFKRVGMHLPDIELPFSSGDNPVRDKLLNGKPHLGSSIVDFFSPPLNQRGLNLIQMLYGIKSVFELPLISDGKIVGFLLTVSRTGEISLEDQHIAELMARQVASAIERSKYTENLENKTKELEKALNKLGEIRTSLEHRVVDRTAEILEQKQFFESLVENSPIAIVTLDLNHKIKSCNPAFNNLFGFAQADIVGEELDGLIAPSEQMTQAKEYTQKVQDGETVRTTGKRTRKDGSLVDVDIFGVPVIVDGNHIGVLALYQDITERVKAEKYYKYIATHDPLTGLPNRSLFYDRLEHALTVARRNQQLVAVMFLDLDGLKEVNDTLGHDAGDLLLKQAAKRFQDCCRESDSVARLAGDEFTFVIENVSSQQDAEIVAHKILQAINIPFNLNEIIFKLTASIGISLFPEHAENPKSLLKKADSAMYDAKHGGKNMITVYQE